MKREQWSAGQTLLNLWCERIVLQGNEAVLPDRMYALVMVMTGQLAL